MSSRRHSNERSAHGLAVELNNEDAFSDTSNNSDDNEIQDDETAAALETVDPLLSAIDDLEGRIVSALDNFKLHPGIKTNTNDNKNNKYETNLKTSVYDELKECLAPVLEIGAHVGPATARHHAAYRPSVDVAIEEVYRRLNSDLILPVLLESAQSDLVASKRAAALGFFHALYRESTHAGSYLEPLTSSSGGLYGHATTNAANANAALLRKQRAQQRSNRTAELLRYWVEGSSSCTVAGAFTDVRADGAIASRAVLSASAVVRPALRHVAEKIASADDAGALKLYIPVMRMIGGVLRRLFSPRLPTRGLNHAKDAESQSVDALRSACIKFLEIVVLCFSSRIQPGAATQGRRSARDRAGANAGNASSEDFAIDDLPVGHPIITRQALEEIGEDAFTIFRGLTIVGGQAKVDSGVMRDVMLGLGLDASGSGSTPSAQIVAILRPAALSFLEVESSMLQQAAAASQTEHNDNLFPILDRTNLDTDFLLSQKSYALAINAVSMLATNRPIFFKDSATCLARRTMDPPKLPSTNTTTDTDTNNHQDDSSQPHPSHLSKAATMAIRSHLKASCLTLLRNSLSVTSGGSTILHQALSSPLNSMKIQADKALHMARQAAALKTAGRAARNRAAIFYEWDQSKGGAAGTMDGVSTAMEDFSKKRQRAGDDALEKMRAAKAARGLGNGIQLPSSMVDACELILVNLRHLPKSRAMVTAGEKKGASTNAGQMNDGNNVGGGSLMTEMKRKRPVNLDFLIDAIMTNGASLASDESRWYNRDGGAAWMMDISALVSDDEGDNDDDDDNNDEEENDGDVPMKKEEEAERAPAPVRFTLDSKTLKAAKMVSEEKETDESKLYSEQCKTAASDAFRRIVIKSSTARDKSIADFGNRIAARLAWTLKGVEPSAELREAKDMALQAITSRANKNRERLDGDKEHKKSVGESLKAFAKEYPLVSSCLSLDMVVTNDRASGTGVIGESTGGPVATGRADSGGNTLAGTSSSLANRVINEAYLQPPSSDQVEEKTAGKYEKSLDIYISSILQACERADGKPNDIQRKKVATVTASSLPHQLAIVPALSVSALELTSAMCDIEEVTKKATEAARKSSNQNLAASAAAHAAKAAAEKRATGALLALRDAAFQRSKTHVRRSAIDCAVGIAAGRLPASSSVEDKALKLVMNVLFPKAADLADAVVASATEEIERAAAYAEENDNRIKKANEEAQSKKQSNNVKNPLQPQSDEEKAALERVRKPVVLFMALCVRRPEIIKSLMKISCREKASVLSKAVRNNMPKLARAAATKYGAAKIALQVSELAEESETPLLLSFLDNLAPADKDLPSQELIEACHEIQSKRVDASGKKDARLIVPVVSGMKREILETKLPEFVGASDIVFKAALRRMSERVGRHALLFREEPDQEVASLNGMTLCEQMVYLHRMDFAAADLPQKRYLDAIRLCLEEDGVFTDRVIMAALDYISGTFLAGEESLPLAYMRTIILTCSKHESLHSWICHVLLPRLIEGRVYTDRRQWEGWMRCAKMLENTGDTGVSSLETIKNLPEEQYRIYRAKYPKKDKTKKL